MKRSFWMLLVCAALLVSLSVPAWAIAPLELDRTGSLTISFKPDGTELSGARFCVYRVADIDKFAFPTLSGPFADAAVEIQPKDPDAWTAVASTLESWVIQNQIQPTAEGKTEQGLLSLQELALGLYLVTGDVLYSGGTKYTPVPFMISIPSLDHQENWVYQLQAAAKYTAQNLPSSSTVERSVLKRWSDTGERRPESISVQLYQDGRPYGEAVSLSEDNNWRTTWTGLPTGYEWRVAELSVPEGYTVTVEQAATTFVLTNTEDEDIPEPDVPLGPGTPELPPTPEIPDDPVPGAPAKPEPPVDTPSTPDIDIPDDDVPKVPLPQTGQLWWPVPVMAGLGLTMFLIGWNLRRRENDG